jgi:uncharacterized membrane protein YkoI
MIFFVSESTMAVSLDNKLLGEKAHYYCSSSEDEDERDDDDKDAGEKETTQKAPEPSIESPKLEKYSGTCTNVRLLPFCAVNVL